MEIRIYNFGPIKEFTLDLSKELMVVYGENNIGKSYAVSVVYIILKRLLDLNFTQLEESNHLEKLINEEAIGKESQDLEKQLNKDECDITDPICNMIKKILGELLNKNLENAIITTFGPLNRLKNVKSKKIPLFDIKFLNDSIGIELGNSVQIKEFQAGKKIIGKITQDHIIIIGREEHHQLIIQDQTKSFRDCLKQVLDYMIKKLFLYAQMTIRKLYFFPASRSGLNKGIQSFVPLIAKLSQIRASEVQKIDLPSYSEPYADYILHLSQIDGIQIGNKGVRDVVRFIEGKILGGEIDFDGEKKVLTYRPAKSGLVLNMNSVSSMVAELAPFVAFIKFLLLQSTVKLEGVPQPIIFIEEPEAHLHPEVQVLLAEVFVKLAAIGVKVIVTSHSNYLFNKFSNMLIAGTLEPAKFAPIVLKNTPKGSVSKLMDADDLGIEDENFIDTADSLYEERERTLDKMNRDADDR